MMLTMFFGLTYKWTKNRPIGGTVMYPRAWDNSDILLMSLLQSSFWPVSLFVWLIIFLRDGFFSVGNLLIKYLETPKVIIVIKSQYDIEAEQEVEKVLAWESLKS